MTLNQPTKNTLDALFSLMDKQELDEALDLLLKETFKKDWKLINPITSTIQQEQSCVSDNL